MSPISVHSARSRRAGILGIVLVSIVLAAALLAPLTRQDPQAGSTSFFRPPSRAHLLGTNDMGQDVLSRLMYGARTSLIVIIGVALFSTALSAAVGSSAALLGGHYERVAMRVVDALLVIPPVLLALLVAIYLRPGTSGLIVLLSLVTWAEGARIMRAQTGMLKQKAYVHASAAFGARLPHILRDHVVPGLYPVLAANFVRAARAAILMEATLAFVGITDPSHVSWGRELYQALSFIHLDSWVWWLLPVGVALCVTILGFTLLGYALEEVIDPRLRGH